MQKATKEFWDDFRWGEQHQSEFLKKYRDRWVAIQNKKIIAAGSNLAQVEQEARRKTGKEWVPVLFVEGGEHIYVQS